MSISEVTCWTIIRGAAAGRAQDRERFARSYQPVIQRYLRARWTRSPLRQEIDDAVQEVFIECFRSDGALTRADPDRAAGFRTYLHGVVRNVARRFEERRGRSREKQLASEADVDQLPADEKSLSEIFDEAWALSLLRQARDLLKRRARGGDAIADRRLRLLRLRFEEALPIREIARRWAMDRDLLHREYRRARRDFKEALLEIVAFHHPGSPTEVEAEAAGLLRILH